MDNGYRLKIISNSNEIQLEKTFNEWAELNNTVRIQHTEVVVRGKEIHILVFYALPR